jgi:hypothetical protein
MPVPTTPSAVPPAQSASAPERFFTETFDSQPPNWDITQVNGDPNLFHAFIEGGRWVFLLDGSYTYVYAIYKQIGYREVRLDVQVANRGADRNFTSLICHFNLDKGWYEFDISNDGAYHILYAVWDAQAKEVHYSPLVDGSSPLIHSGSADNVYGAICKGSFLALIINGEQVHSFNEDEYGLNNGQVGIGVSSFDVLPVRVEFDSVTVSAPQ